jgi:hypothetical protein
MESAMDLAGGVLSAVAGLGVPWWGWIALVVMIFWGLLGPGGQEGDEQRDTVPGLGPMP